MAKYLAVSFCSILLFVLLLPFLLESELFLVLVSMVMWALGNTFVLVTLIIVSLTITAYLFLRN